MFWRLLALGMFTATAATAADDTRYSGAADWSGAYAGVNIGVAHTTGRAERGAYSGALITLDVNNGLFPGSISGSAWDLTGGASLGYNMQRGMFVGGLEVDVALSDIDVANRLNVVDPGPLFPGVNTITTYQTQIDALGTARLRAGYAFGDTLVFATGGLAAGHVTNRFTLELPNFPGPPGPFTPYTSPDWSSSGLLYGYTYGAGVEQRLNDRMSVKADVLAIDLQDVTISAADPATFPGNAIDYTFNNMTVIGRIGLNLKF